MKFKMKGSDSEKIQYLKMKKKISVSLTYSYIILLVSSFRKKMSIGAKITIWNSEATVAAPH
jgi:hypothetical protein